MPYIVAVPILLGAANAGKTLRSQLFDSEGNPVEGTIDTGFVERGDKGTYLWTGPIPYGFCGGLEIRDAGTDPETVLTLTAIGTVLGEAGLAPDSPYTPVAEPTMEQALMLLYMALRNQLDTAATELKFHDSSGTVIARAALSDDGVTFVREAMTAP